MPEQVEIFDQIAVQLNLRYVSPLIVMFNDQLILNEVILHKYIVKDLTGVLYGTFLPILRTKERKALVGFRNGDVFAAIVKRYLAVQRAVIIGDCGCSGFRHERAVRND